MPTYAAFSRVRRLAAGSLLDVARAVDAEPQAERVLILDDDTGRPVELDLRGGPEAAVRDHDGRNAPEGERRGRGRPRLGVVAREVTLLPRHWDWLAAQPAGASATLRRLVDEARRNEGDADRERVARDALYRAMSALAGDLPRFEDAARALFAADAQAFHDAVAAWPSDVADYVLGLDGAPRG